MPFREFHVRGEGVEKTINSSRSRPQLLLTDPIRINRFNVKTVEIPLTFQPKVYENSYAFFTTYTFNTGATVKFKDYLIFTDSEVLDGPTIMDHIEKILIIHAAGSMTANIAAYSSSEITITGTVPGAISLDNAPRASVLTDPALRGVPFIDFDPDLDVTAGAVTSVTRMDIDLVAQSILASFFDLPYYGSAIIPVATTNMSGRIETATNLHTMRTRPAYIYLHSNIRAGASYLSTGRPTGNSSSNTVIAKVTLPFTTEGFGDTVTIWNNPCLHPDLMFTASDVEYSYLEFWCTYPDGTEVDFNENSFSLTLMTIVY